MATVNTADHINSADHIKPLSIFVMPILLLNFLSASLALSGSFLPLKRKKKGGNTNMPCNQIVTNNVELRVANLDLLMKASG